MQDDDEDTTHDDDEDTTHDEWLDRWLEKCAALSDQVLVCPLAGTEECDFECPFRTKFDGPRKVAPA